MCLAQPGHSIRTELTSNKIAELNVTKIPPQFLSTKQGIGLVISDNYLYVDFISAPLRHPVRQMSDDLPP
jgi:hypothetical protein